MQTLKDFFCHGGKNLQHLNMLHESITEFKTNTERQTEKRCCMYIHIYTSYYQLTEFKMPWVLVSWMEWQNIVHWQLVQYPSLLLLPLASFPLCSYLKQLFYPACLAPTWPPLTPPRMLQCCWESFPSAMWQVISILAISTNVRMSSREDEQFFLTYPAFPSLTSASCIWH